MVTMKTATMRMMIQEVPSASYLPSLPPPSSSPEAYLLGSRNFRNDFLSPHRSQRPSGLMWHLQWHAHNPSRFANQMQSVCSFQHLSRRLNRHLPYPAQLQQGHPDQKLFHAKMSDTGRSFKILHSQFLEDMLGICRIKRAEFFSLRRVELLLSCLIDDWLIDWLID